MHRRFLYLATSLALVAHGSVAVAQTASSESGFAIDRFEPSDRGSSWFVLDSLDWRGDLKPFVGLTADFANRPLVVYDDDGSERMVIVENQLYTHVSAALVVKDNFRFGLNLLVILTQSGDLGTVGSTMFPPPDSAAIGDIRLSAAVRFLGGPGAKLSLGVGLAAYLPTGKRDQYSGDEKVRLLPHLLLGGRVDAWQYAAKVGFHYRGLEDAIDDAALGSELFGAASVGVRLADDRLLIGPELYGSTVVSESDAAFGKRTSPIEGLLGAHYGFANGLTLSGGAGLGLTRGLGSPAFRIVAGLEWTGVESKEPAPLPPPPPPPPEPEPAPPPPPDRDGDGVIDAEDACPDVPGVRTDDPKTNGCPPPPPDRDGDTVLDADDACPDVPGIVTNDPKTNGCPTARIEKQQIIIVEQIKFKFNSAVILPESEPVLNAVRAILVEHPEIARVRVEGHTDKIGSAKYNQNLSRRRAQSVVKWLVKSGIAKTRLYGLGFGFERPIDSNDTDEGRQNNRRVEFHIEMPEAKN